MIHRSVQVQTDFYHLPGDPSGPKVFFRCITPDSKVHQLKLASDCAMQVLVVKLPFSGPYVWHEIEVDPRLSPSHYNMLPGEENCVTLYCRGAEKVTAGGGFDTTSDKVRSLNYKIRCLEEEIETKNRVLHQVYAQHSSIDELREEVESLRFENAGLKEDKRRLTGKVVDMEDSQSYHVRATTVPEAPMLDPDRDDTIAQLKNEMSKWQASVNSSFQGKSSSQPVIVPVTNFRAAVGAPAKGHGDTTALMSLMGDVLKNLKGLPNEINSIVKSMSPQTPGGYTRPVTSGAGTDRQSTTLMSRARSPSLTTHSVHHPTPIQSHYPARSVRVVYINEATGDEEHERLEVIPPVNVKRSLEAVKIAKRGALNLAKAVVCIQADGYDPIVVDPMREARKVLQANDILYIAFLK